MWWMGFDQEALIGHHLNNWNPWCNMNVLAVSILNDFEREFTVAVITKTLSSVEVYINHLSQDGGCDEGTNYWGEAAGSLLIYMHLLLQVTNEKLFLT